MLAMIGGIVAVTMVGRGARSCVVEPLGMDRRVDYVHREVTGQPDIDGDGEHAEPHADPIPAQPPHFGQSPEETK
jgi:hypothetical protein